MALDWLKANEFPLRKLFRERHRAGPEDRQEEHPHSLYIGPEWYPTFGLEVLSDKPVFGAGARAATRLHCEQTITDIAAFSEGPPPTSRRDARKTQANGSWRESAIGGWLKDGKVPALSGGREGQATLGQLPYLDEISSGCTRERARHRAAVSAFTNLPFKH